MRIPFPSRLDSTRLDTVTALRINIHTSRSRAMDAVSAIPSCVFLVGGLIGVEEGGFMRVVEGKGRKGRIAGEGGWVEWI